MENNKTITVEARVHAPVEKVWEYWTKPEHITKWTFASDDWHAPYAENNLKSGGTFKTTMAAKDGSMRFDFGGTYSNIEEFSLIAYEMADGRKVSINFSFDGHSTYISEKFDPEKENPAEMQQNGWQAILNNFKKYVEEN
ncbi:SRPBCC family protein [Pedobacter sp. MW01-1-1]|uniref:SRPBCC family protein n=1 Tax=Pedobacter sp. MW01-1-1 TaxID=3383027 RepID=UPI003FF07772